MVADFAISPVGLGPSLSPYVAEAFKIIERSGVAYQHHAMGTNLEGEWDEVMAVIKACRDAMLASADRVSITIKIDDRPGAGSRLDYKVRSAQEKM